jgi:hypothetical protein
VRRSDIGIGNAAQVGPNVLIGLARLCISEAERFTFHRKSSQGTGISRIKHAGNKGRSELINLNAKDSRFPLTTFVSDWIDIVTYALSVNPSP